MLPWLHQVSESSPPEVLASCRLHSLFRPVRSELDWAPGTAACGGGRRAGQWATTEQIPQTGVGTREVL